MKCYRVRRLIEDYHDGELSESERAAVAAHLSACPGCRDEFSLLETERKMYDAYAARTEGALELPQEMIAKVAARASSEGAAAAPDGHRWYWRMLIPATPWIRQALAAVILMAVSVSGTLLLVRHYRADERAETRAANAVNPGDRSLEAALQSIQRAEQEYISAIRVLTDIMEKQKPTLDQRTLAEVQVNLEMIDRHIEATRRAYHEHPNNPELALYMLAAYSRKVELLQELTS